MKTLRCAKYLILVLFLSFGSLMAYGQDADTKSKVIQLKLAFLTEELNLTDQETEKFFPIYKEYMNAKSEIKEKYKDNSDADNHIKKGEEEAALNKEYNAKFKKVLPVEKVGKLYMAEKEFIKQVLKAQQNR